LVGKPSYLNNEHDVDWVPSKNLSNLQQHEESGIENVADCSLQSDMSMNDWVMNSTSITNENTAPYNPLNCNLSINGNSMSENLFSEEEKSTFCYLQFQVLGNYPTSTRTFIGRFKAVHSVWAGYPRRTLFLWTSNKQMYPLIVNLFKKKHSFFV
jgi:hypothetical protein